MGLLHLDHASVCTANLKPLITFYTEVIGLHSGPRPNFSFGGAWMYCGERPCVHLIEQPDIAGVRTENLQLAHFAFRAENLKEFLGRLRRHGVPYRVGIVQDFEICQINVFDPDGNHVHVDFPAAEARALNLSSTPKS